MSARRRRDKPEKAWLLVRGGQRDSHPKPGQSRRPGEADAWCERREAHHADAEGTACSRSLQGLGEDTAGVLQKEQEPACCSRGQGSGGEGPKDA